MAKCSFPAKADSMFQLMIDVIVSGRECYTDCNIIACDRFGAPVMFWGGICFDGRINLHSVRGRSLTAVGYRDEILRPIVLPSAGAFGYYYVFMQDDVCAHTATVVLHFY